MTSIADMIKDIQSGEAAGVEDKFNALMADRMAAAIETKYDSMFGSQEQHVQDEPEIEEQDLEPEEPETEE